MININENSQSKQKHSKMHQQFSLTPIDQQNAPHQFICPISKQIMKNPVITSDGYSFQKIVIEKWFHDKNKSPITGLEIDRKLIQNRALKQSIKFHNFRQGMARQNAQKLIDDTNSYIKSILPELINQIGLLDLDKIVAISIQNAQLRKMIRKMQEQLNKLKYKLNQTESKRKKSNEQQNKCQNCILNYCDSCKYTRTTLFNCEQLLLKSDNIISSAPLVPSINTQAKQFKYFIVSCQILKHIDFKGIKYQDFNPKVFKSYGIQKSSIQTIMRRIKTINKISDSDVVNVYRVKNPTIQNLFYYLQKQIKRQNCLYQKQVINTGHKINKTSIQFGALNLQPDQYLIVDYGKQDSLVFRQQYIRCQYCYHQKPQKFKCQCQKAMYCSLPCANKDIQYHQRLCLRPKVVKI